MMDTVLGEPSRGPSSAGLLGATLAAALPTNLHTAAADNPPAVTHAIKRLDRIEIVVGLPELLAQSLDLVRSSTAVAIVRPHKPGWMASVSGRRSGYTSADAPQRSRVALRPIPAEALACLFRKFPIPRSSL